MTAGPVEEGVTQEKQIVITVSSLTFSYTYLPYFSLHLIAGLLETAHGEKSQTVITALYPTILSTSIYTDQFAIYAILWLNKNTPYLLTQCFLIV